MKMMEVVLAPPLSLPDRVEFLLRLPPHPSPLDPSLEAVTEKLLLYQEKNFRPYYHAFEHHSVLDVATCLRFQVDSMNPPSHVAAVVAVTAGRRIFHQFPPYPSLPYLSYVLYSDPSLMSRQL